MGIEEEEGRGENWKKGKEGEKIDHMIGKMRRGREGRRTEEEEEGSIIYKI